MVVDGNWCAVPVVSTTDDILVTPISASAALQAPVELPGVRGPAEFTPPERTEYPGKEMEPLEPHEVPERGEQAERCVDDFADLNGP